MGLKRVVPRPIKKLASRVVRGIRKHRTTKHKKQQQQEQHKKQEQREEEHARVGFRVAVLASGEKKKKEENPGTLRPAALFRETKNPHGGNGDGLPEDDSATTLSTSFSSSCGSSTRFGAFTAPPNTRRFGGFRVGRNTMAALSPRHRGAAPPKHLLRGMLLVVVAVWSGSTFSHLRWIQPRLVAIDDDFFSPHNTTTTTTTAPFHDHNHSDDEDSLPCLVHGLVEVHAPAKKVRDPNKTVLASSTPDVCGRLRRTWRSNPPTSPLARALEAHQSDCSLPEAIHFMDNTYGLGSHFILWGQALCNALQPVEPIDPSSSSASPFRMVSRSPGPWLWLDRSHCHQHDDDDNDDDESPLACYFPSAERRCPHDDQTQHLPLPPPPPADEMPARFNVSDPRDKRLYCPLVKEDASAFRAAATEYLFSELSPLVIAEAKRQAGLLFLGGMAPPDLITVHIRWGDKFWEMDLPPIEEYVEAVRGLARANTTTSIYLATEDPRAQEAFLEAASREEDWRVYSDVTLAEIDAFRPPKGNRASWATRNTKGRAGLVALGSLLVAMEANDFVLTTKSNWSTLMNHLRTNLIDPRCGNCTRVVDLRPHVYY